MFAPHRRFVRRLVVRGLARAKSDMMIVIHDACAFDTTLITALDQRVTRLAHGGGIDRRGAIAPRISDIGRDRGNLFVGQQPAE